MIKWRFKTIFYDIHLYILRLEETENGYISKLYISHIILKP
jgi:hypothetical protein